MPECPIKRGSHVDRHCKNRSCYLNVRSLDYGCLVLHQHVYNMEPTTILNSLYGKRYKMSVALAIKSARISYAINDLSQEPDRVLSSSLEKQWIKDIEKAGSLKDNSHWTTLTENNGKYLFRDRMLQVLNTMEVQFYSLPDILQSYMDLFGDVDPTAFGFHKEQKDELLQLIQ